MKQVAYLIADAIDKSIKHTWLFQKNALKYQGKKAAPKTGNFPGHVSLYLNLVSLWEIERMGWHFLRVVDERTNVASSYENQLVFSVR